MLTVHEATRQAMGLPYGDPRAGEVLDRINPDWRSCTGVYTFDLRTGCNCTWHTARFIADYNADPAQFLRECFPNGMAGVDDEAIAKAQHKAEILAAIETLRWKLNAFDALIGRLVALGTDHGVVRQAECRRKMLCLELEQRLEDQRCAK